jgi:hypothetical protein
MSIWRLWELWQLCLTRRSLKMQRGCRGVPLIECVVRCVDRARYVKCKGERGCCVSFIQFRIESSTDRQGRYKTTQAREFKGSVWAIGAAEIENRD